LTRNRANMLKLLVKFIKLTDSLLQVFHLEQCLRLGTKFQLALQVFLFVELLKLKINASIIIVAIHQGVIGGPDILILAGRYRSNTLPFFLNFLDSTNTVSSLFSVYDLPKPLQNLVFGMKIFISRLLKVFQRSSSSFLEFIESIKKLFVFISFSILKVIFCTTFSNKVLQRLFFFLFKNLIKNRSQFVDLRVSMEIVRFSQQFSHFLQKLLLRKPAIIHCMFCMVLMLFPFLRRMGLHLFNCTRCFVFRNLLRHLVFFRHFFVVLHLLMSTPIILLL